jgi:class 3 adenylate cyclase/pimeloyl-ACP methyl ester carboxylesterase
VSLEPTFGYARAADGAYLGYLTVGEGPLDFVYQIDWFGDVELTWEYPADHVWFEALASLGRLILHDRRGTGLSSRNVPPPNLETRVADTLAVMDALGSEQPVLISVLEGGAPNAMLAATRPDRARALVWLEPVPRSTATPDYPWARSEADTAREHVILPSWGTTEFGEAFIALETSLGNEFLNEEAPSIARLSRHWCTPDVALELARIWDETDVRAVIPSISVPTLFMVHGARESAREEMEHLLALNPGIVGRYMPGSAWTDAEVPAWIDEIRRFVGIERPATGLDTILASLLFTDLVGSTARQVELGDRAWKAVVERHNDVVRHALERWRGVERDTAGDGFFATFDGPARAIRCALEIADQVRPLGLELRAGIHTGECEVIESKVGGVAVSIGARIVGRAGPSEVLVSQTVKDLVAGSGLAFEDRGEHQLQGIPDPWRLYRATPG